jgi:3-methyladenine DNA glycosylase AlkD
MPSKKIKPEELAKKALLILRGKSDPEHARQVQRYFKEEVKSYGLTAPEIRSLASELYKTIKSEWRLEDAIRLCDILFPEPELEAKSVAALILIRYKRDLPKEFMTRVKEWLAADYLNNWASVDGFCPEVMGELLERYPELIEEIKTWTVHPNRWVKRASAVSFLKLSKKEQYLPTIYEIATRLFSVDDDLIQKATGWLLREAGKRDMGRLERFLLRHGPAIPRTTLRYAIERFDRKKRKEFLMKTRSRTS